MFAFMTFYPCRRVSSFSLQRLTALFTVELNFGFCHKITSVYLLNIIISENRQSCNAKNVLISRHQYYVGTETINPIPLQAVLLKRIWATDLFVRSLFFYEFSSCAIDIIMI